MWWQARMEEDILWRGTWLSTHFSWTAQSSIRGIWIVEDSGLDCWTNGLWSTFVLLKLSIHTHSGTNILSSLCPMRIMYEIFFLNMLELSRTWWIWVKDQQLSKCKCQSGRKSVWRHNFISYKAQRWNKAQKREKGKIKRKERASEENSCATFKTLSGIIFWFLFSKLTLNAHFMNKYNYLNSCFKILIFKYLSMECRSWEI